MSLGLWSEASPIKRAAPQACDCGAAERQHDMIAATSYCVPAFYGAADGKSSIFSKRCPHAADAGAPRSDDSCKQERKPHDEADYLSYTVTSRSCHVIVFSFQNAPGDSGRGADQLPGRRIAQRRRKVYQIARVLPRLERRSEQMNRFCSILNQTGSF